MKRAGPKSGRSSRAFPYRSVASATRPSSVALRTSTQTSSRAPTARDAALAYCQGTPLRSEIEGRDPGGLDRATDHAGRAIADRWGEGPVSAAVRGFVVEAAVPA